MTDLLTSLQQQIEKLSHALCQIPGNLYLKTTSDEDTNRSVDLKEGIPDIHSISSKLAVLIDAVPSLEDSDDLPKRKERIVELWNERNALDEQLDEATELLQRLHGRLTALHEALVINTRTASKRKSSETLEMETLPESKRNRTAKDKVEDSTLIKPETNSKV